MLCDLFRAVDVVNIDLVWPKEEQAVVSTKKVKHHFESEIFSISFCFC
jgi:hypothetical protein